jgi:hypothetical protein
MVAGIGAVVLLAGIVAVAPLLVETDAVKRAVERRVAAAIGGAARYETISLSFLPRPRVQLRGLTVSVPDAVEGRIAAADVRIALLPLIAGDVRPVSVQIEQPELTIRRSPDDSPDPMAAYRAAAGPIVDTLSREAPGMSVTVAGGSLNIVSGSQPLLALSDLKISADTFPDKLVANFSAAANIWRGARGQLSIAAGSLATSAKVAFNGLNGDKVIATLTGDGALALRPGAVDVSLEVETDGRDTVRVTANVAANQLRIERGARALELGASKLAWEDARVGEDVTVTLRALQLGQLLPSATGTLRMRKDGAQPAFELQVPALDLGRLREASLVLAGDLAAVRTVAGMVTTGTLRGLTLNVAGADFDAFSQLKAVAASAEFEAATVAVPAAGILVRNGSGRLSLAEGVLQTSETSGAIGRSTFRSGTLAVELVPAVTLRSLRAEVDADLPDALAITRSLLDPQNGTALSEIESLQGRASGSVTYEVRGNPHLAVKLAKLQAGGRLRGVPFPLEVSQGELKYAGERLDVRGLAGSAGRSRLQNGSAEIVLGAAPAVRSARGSVVAAFDELYPWLSSLEGLRKPLSALTGVTGSAEVDLARLSGLLAQPEAFDYEAVVRPKDLRISGAALPGTLILASGAVNITPRAMRFERLAASVLDARAAISGSANDFTSPSRRLELTLADGVAGQKSLEWARARWAIPARVMPGAPVALSSGRLEWSGAAGSPLLAQGTAGLAGGAQAGFDVTWQPGNLDLRRLTLKDADSDLVFLLKWGPAVAEAGFTGRLDHRTLAGVLAEPPPIRAVLQGDFRAALDLREPQRSTATGRLEGEGIDIFERLGFPVVIDRFRVEAAGETLQLHDSSLKLSGQAIGLSGTARRAQDAFAVDLRAVADKLDVQRIRDSLSRGDAARRPSGGGWDLPIVGRVAISVGSVTYGTHVLQQVAALVTLEPKRIVAEVTDARLCGVSLPFTAAFVPDRVEVKTQLKARGAELGGTLSCLAGEQLEATGGYDLDAEFFASGRGDALLQGARGSFRFAARNGRIQRAVGLSRALDVDEVATRTRARAQELMAGGLAYEEIRLAGTLDAGRVRLEHVIVDSPVLGITVSGEIGIADHTVALQGLVAPLDNTSRVVKRVPIVGRVLGTSLVVIPVSITGDLRDPKVQIQPAAAIGASLVNLMSATLKAPIELLDPSAGKAPRSP